MRIRIKLDDNYRDEPEIIIHCREVNRQVNDIISLLEMKKKKLAGYIEGEEHVIDPSNILYFESVDGTVFIYIKEQVYRSNYTLNEIEATYYNIGYFRSSKSTIVNIHKIKSLKSEWGNRIDALLTNGEHVIISRHYAKELRTILREVSSI